ncbi:glycine cleavage system protein H [Chloroflexota bacterium]
MSIKKIGKQRGKEQAGQKSQPVTRRHFLKEAGLVVGGAAISSVALTTACGSSENTSTAGTTTTTPANTTTGSATPSTTVTTSNTPSPTDKPVITITTSTDTWSGEYLPPVENPEKQPIRGCTTFVAMDRLYAVEHMWVKSIAVNTVAIGITEIFLEYLEDIFVIELPDVGTVALRDSFSGSVEAKKMNLEFIAPVSGIVLLNNDKALADPKWVNRDPWGSGWLQVIQLSNPQELQDLMTPEKYISYNAKIVVA